MIKHNEWHIHNHIHSHAQKLSFIHTKHNDHSLVMTNCMKQNHHYSEWVTNFKKLMGVALNKRQNLSKFSFGKHPVLGIKLSTKALI